MLERIVRLAMQWRIFRLQYKLDALESRLLVVLADLWHRQAPHNRADHIASRVLVSGSHHLFVRGTDHLIKAAADELQRQTKQCVIIAVVVGAHHVADCGDAIPNRDPNSVEN